MPVETVVPVEVVAPAKVADKEEITLHPVLVEALKANAYRLAFELVPLDTSNTDFWPRVAIDWHGTLNDPREDSLTWINQQKRPEEHPQPYTREEVLAHPLLKHEDSFITEQQKKFMLDPQLANTIKCRQEGVEALEKLKQVELRPMIVTASTSGIHEATIQSLDTSKILDLGYIALEDIIQQEASNPNEKPDQFKDKIYKIIRPAFVIDDSSEAVKAAAELGIVAFWVDSQAELPSPDKLVSRHSRIIRVGSVLEAAQQIALAKEEAKKLVGPMLQKIRKDLLESVQSVLNNPAY